ncbi:unnamed protein product [Allacma fusca]|uniref:Uncharacterized protein n=1 Tax=Allacma fusca TaxID=39272 RepID=A0A8J2KRN7_9HEXA|nr:unnamed protein product [Allacma fusca]
MTGLVVIISTSPWDLSEVRTFVGRNWKRIVKRFFNLSVLVLFQKKSSFPSTPKNTGSTCIWIEDPLFHAIDASKLARRI